MMFTEQEITNLTLIFWVIPGIIYGIIYVIIKIIGTVEVVGE